MQNVINQLIQEGKLQYHEAWKFEGVSTLKENGKTMELTVGGDSYVIREKGNIVVIGWEDEVLQKVKDVTLEQADDKIKTMLKGIENYIKKIYKEYTIQREIKGEVEEVTIWLIVEGINLSIIFEYDKQWGVYRYKVVYENVCESKRYIITDNNIFKGNTYVFSGLEEVKLDMLKVMLREEQTTSLATALKYYWGLSTLQTDIGVGVTIDVSKEKDIDEYVMEIFQQKDVLFPDNYINTVCKGVSGTLNNIKHGYNMDKLVLGNELLKYSFKPIKHKNYTEYYMELQEKEKRILDIMFK